METEIDAFSNAMLAKMVGFPDFGKRTLSGVKLALTALSLHRKNLANLFIGRLATD
jgi:hypothetical protein